MTLVQLRAQELAGPLVRVVSDGGWMLYFLRPCRDQWAVQPYGLFQELPMEIVDESVRLILGVLDDMVKAQPAARRA
jgi:hypothetical protein